MSRMFPENPIHHFDEKPLLHRKEKPFIPKSVRLFLAVLFLAGLTKLGDSLVVSEQIRGTAFSFEGVQAAWSQEQVQIDRQLTEHINSFVLARLVTTLPTSFDWSTAEHWQQDFSKTLASFGISDGEEIPIRLQLTDPENMPGYDGKACLAANQITLSNKLREEGDVLDVLSHEVAHQEVGDCERLGWPYLRMSEFALGLHANEFSETQAQLLSLKTLATEALTTDNSVRHKMVLSAIWSSLYDITKDVKKFLAAQDAYIHTNTDKIDTEAKMNFYYGDLPFLYIQEAWDDPTSATFPILTSYIPDRVQQLSLGGLIEILKREGFTG